MPLRRTAFVVAGAALPAVMPLAGSAPAAEPASARVDTRGSTAHRRNLWSTTPAVGIQRHAIRLETVGTPGRPAVVVGGIGRYR